MLLRDPCRRFETRALLCTDLAQEPLQILRCFVQRWQLEVTFREVRDHLGVETQRQWWDKATARNTPCLLGLFSVVALLASRLNSGDQLRLSASAWYHKLRPILPTAFPPYGGRFGVSRVSHCSAMLSKWPNLSLGAGSVRNLSGVHRLNVQRPL